MAGVMALADDHAGFHHGFANPALYDLAGTDAFRDVRGKRKEVAVARNNFNNGVNGNDGISTVLRTTDRDTSLHARRGYDDVTGLGSPAGAAFLEGLSGR